MIEKIKNGISFLTGTPKDAKGMMLWLIILPTAGCCILSLLAAYIIVIKDYPGENKIPVAIGAYSIAILFWTIVTIVEYRKAISGNNNTSKIPTEIS